MCVLCVHLNCNNKVQKYKTVLLTDINEAEFIFSTISLNVDTSRKL